MLHENFSFCVMIISCIIYIVSTYIYIYTVGEILKWPNAHAKFLTWKLFPKPGRNFQNRLTLPGKIFQASNHSQHSQHLEIPESASPILKTNQYNLKTGPFFRQYSQVKLHKLRLPPLASMTITYCTRKGKGFCENF